MRAGLYFINLKSELWESLEECHAMGKINLNHVFLAESAAPHATFHCMNKSICRSRKVRIFLECSTVPHADDPGELANGRKLMGL